ALDDAWKKVLFNQFHDIAAGSGIATLYRDAARDYAEVARIAERARGDGLEVLTARVDSRGAGAPLLVWTPLSWERSDVVEAEVALPAGEGVRVRDGDGRAV